MVGVWSSNRPNPSSTLQTVVYSNQTQIDRLSQKT
jgi:hypothetical protein